MYGHEFIQYVWIAVTVLKVEYIIVCGPYGCGGVGAAMDPMSYGFVCSWLRNIKEVYVKHSKELEAIADKEDRFNKLVELNIMEEVRNLTQTKIVQKAFMEGSLKIHGWIYGMEDGFIKDLNVMYDEVQNIERSIAILICKEEAGY